MSEQMNNTNAVFMEVTSRKVEGQDKKIALLEEKIKSLPDSTGQIQELQGMIEQLRKEIKGSHSLMEKVQNFPLRLDLAMDFLKQPVENKVVHHHYVPKLIWITAGLLTLLSLVCSGWYVTGNKLDNYIANDTKYRQLRLDTAQRSLQRYLDRVDSLYDVWPDMRKTVLKTEEEYRLNFERLQKAERLRTEAKELESKAR